MSVWKYRIEQDFTFQHALFNGVAFSSEWIRIDDGELIIRSGYAWDGCSPKLNILGLFYIGTPDGALRFGKSWTWEASLVHDALTQYQSDLALPKNQVQFCT